MVQRGCGLGVQSSNHQRHYVQTLKSRRVPLAAPSEPATIQMDFLNFSIIDESSKSAHHPTIQQVIIFILRPVNEVEISAQQPRPAAPTPHSTQLLQEEYFVTVSLGAVDTNCPPILIGTPAANLCRSRKIMEDGIGTFPIVSALVWLM